jgi:hypothetical protein
MTNKTELKLYLVKYDLPAYWASYLINGDASGISDDDKQAADSWLKHNDLPGPARSIAPTSPILASSRAWAATCSNSLFF